MAIILATGNFLLDQAKRLSSSNADLLTLARANDDVLAHRQRIVAALQARIAGVGRESLARIDQRIEMVAQSLRSGLAEQETPLAALPLAGPAQYADRLADRYKGRLTAEVARQELAYLQQARAYLVAGSDRATAHRELDRLRIAHTVAYARLQERKRAIDQLGPVDRLRIKYAGIRGRRLGALSTDYAQSERDNLGAHAAYRSQESALLRMRAIAQPPVFSVDQHRFDKVDGDLRDRLAQARAAVSGNWLSRIVTPIVEILPLAMLVLLSSFVGHFAVKALFYFVLAPLATGRPPICLDKTACGQVEGRRAGLLEPARPAVSSAVSQAVWLAPNEELLVLPEYLQSSSVHARKDTKWLLDKRRPWTSLLSGMYALTRLRAQGSDDRIVLSAGDDPLSEIALIHVPAGSAMVFQPRGMVGVIYDNAVPLTISPRWRLGSLHAWLTLQWRYLIFRGPVTLIVRGTRGVRVEPAGLGRIVSQAATLGFSANLDYSTIRSETFFPYYQNKTALLQDRFDGEGGVYVYDETPAMGQRSGFLARGLEGVADAFLKALRI